jgi:Kef-type K+ transport system membrane component KefB
MTLLSIHNLSLPIEDPVLKFLLVLIIILAAPLLLNKIKVPHLLGLIIAGAVIGPNGFNVLGKRQQHCCDRNYRTALHHVSCRAGNRHGRFQKNKWKSLTFGIYTFTVPFVLGYFGAYYILHFRFLRLFFLPVYSRHTH